MDTVTVAEIGRTPGAILGRSESLIVTNNGRAQNLVINVSGMDIDAVVDLARSMQARSALASLRKQARAVQDDISIEDIDDEVTAARARA